MANGLFFLVMCALTAAVGSPARAEDDSPIPGILGKDDRTTVPDTGKSFDAVGHINVTSFSRRRRCTGTLIAPDRVVTAAHCLVDRSGKPRPVSHIHFVAGVHLDDYLGHSKAKCVLLARGRYKRENAFSPSLFNDIAVVVLREDIDIPPLPPLEEGAAFAENSLLHVSYPRDSRYALLAHTGCRLRGRRHKLWLTDCDTTRASSGGPVLVRTGSGLRIGAVMAGYIPKRYSIAVPVSAWRGLLRRQGCP